MLYHSLSQTILYIGNSASGCHLFLQSIRSYVYLTRPVFRKFRWSSVLETWFWLAMSEILVRGIDILILTRPFLKLRIKASDPLSAWPWQRSTILIQNFTKCNFVGNHPREKHYSTSKCWRRASFWTQFWDNPTVWNHRVSECHSRNGVLSDDNGIE